MQQYLDLLRHVLDNGHIQGSRAKLSNGSKPKTISCFAPPSMRFDLRDGFPLATSKFVSFRSVTAELLWFLSGSTNVKGLEAQGVNIWSAWQDSAGDIGPSYGKQWRRWHSIKRVRPRAFQASEFSLPDRVIPSNLVVEPGDDLIGRNLGNPGSGYRVLGRNVSKDDGIHKYYAVQFSETGYVAPRVRRDKVISGLVKDRFKKSAYGVGCMGDEFPDDTIGKSLRKDLHTTWSRMLERCYLKSCPAYPRYGGQGITVDGDWLIFANFLRDAKDLPGWHLKRWRPKSYQIDKDYFGASVYSKDSCRWVNLKTQSGCRSHIRPFEATDPAGRKYVGVTKAVFGAMHGLDRAYISAVLKGNLQSYLGWSFRYIDPEGWLYREHVVDQVDNLIAGIEAVKIDPESPLARRLIISAWNVSDIPDMAIPPCHVMAQWYVHDGKLSCRMYQRSCDLFLGCPYNTASYALLTHLLARVTGLEAHELIHTFGDAHIYENHLPQVREQLTRTPHPLPRLVIDDSVTDIDNLSLDQFRLEGYTHHAKLAGEVAV